MISECEKCAELAAEGATHPCPYVEEIEGDDSDVCACCPDCEYDCQVSI